MPSTKVYLDYVLFLLEEVNNVTYKKMMGEYLLYSAGVLFGGIYDDRFLIKETKSISSLDLKKDIPYPNAKPMILVDIEEKKKIKELIDIVLNDLK